MTVKVPYTALAIADGGRNRTTKSSDGLVDVKLSEPKPMGGPGKPGTTTPEDLFAASYAACFEEPASSWARRWGSSPP